MSEPYNNLGDCPVNTPAHYFRNHEIETCPSLTIRQWYKGGAMKGILSSHDVNPIKTILDGNIERTCGKMADAMIREDEEHAKKAK